MQLFTGGKTNIEATLVQVWIGKKNAQGFHFVELQRLIGMESLSYLFCHVDLYLIESPTDSWTKGHNQVLWLCSSRC